MADGLDVHHKFSGGSLRSVWILNCVAEHSLQALAGHDKLCCAHMHENCMARRTIAKRGRQTRCHRNHVGIVVVNRQYWGPPGETAEGHRKCPKYHPWKTEQCGVSKDTCATYFILQWPAGGIFSKQIQIFSNTRGTFSKTTAIGNLRDPTRNRWVAGLKMKTLFVNVRPPTFLRDGFLTGTQKLGILSKRALRFRKVCTAFESTALFYFVCAKSPMQKPLEMKQAQIFESAPSIIFMLVFLNVLQQKGISFRKDAPFSKMWGTLSKYSPSNMVQFFISSLSIHARSTVVWCSRQSWFLE